MYWLVLIVISLIISWVFNNYYKEEQYWNLLVGALVGAWLGEIILGDWGWMLADFNVIAGIIGSIVIGWLYLLILTKIRAN